MIRRSHLTLFLASLIIAFVGVFIISNSKVEAATINVSNGVDTVASDSVCHLSEAIENINDQAATNSDCVAGDGRNDTIQIPTGTITLTTNLPALQESITIQGITEGSSIIDGANSFSVSLTPTVSVSKLSISNLTIQNGNNLGIWANPGSGDTVQLIADNVTLKNGTGNLIIGGEARQMTATNITISSPDVTSQICQVYVENDSTLQVVADNIKIRNCNGNSAVIARPNSTITASNVDFTNIDIETSEVCVVGVDQSNSTVPVSVSINKVRINGCSEGALVQARENSASTTGGPSLYNISDINISENNIALFTDTDAEAAMFIEISSSNTNLILERASVTNNTAVTSGSDNIANAGIQGVVPPTATIRNLTVANNDISGTYTAEEVYSGIALLQHGVGQPLVTSQLTVVDNTATNNASGGAAAGILLGSFDAGFTPVDNIGILQNSLISNNISNGQKNNCNASIALTGSMRALPISGGGNISDDSTCTTFTDTADKNNVSSANLELQAPANNGGFIPTVALGSSSIAVDNGITIESVTQDARKISRPQGCAYDIGAYELEQNICASPSDDGLLADTGTNVSSIIILVFSIIGAFGVAVIFASKIYYESASKR